MVMVGIRLASGYCPIRCEGEPAMAAGEGGNGCRGGGWVLESECAMVLMAVIALRKG